MLLRAITGSENWKNHSAKLHVFYSPTLAGLREIHLGLAAKDSAVPITQVRGNSICAKPGFRESTGLWDDRTFEVAENLILKIFASKSGSFGQMAVSANIFILARAEAALRRVRFALSNDPAAALSAAFVEGRFDLLTYDEARLLGAKVLPAYKSFSEPAFVNRLFETTETEPQIRPRVSLEERTVQVAGASVSVPVRRRLRAMP